jgi:hypothetical protein
MRGVTLRMTRLVMTASLLGWIVGSMGCAFGEFYWDDPTLREYSLKGTQKQYSDYVRFGAYAHASQFVDPELVDEYLEKFPKQADFNFTDYEPGPVKFDDIETRETATSKVTYTGYSSSTLLVVEIVETQKWYRDSDLNFWKVRSSFEGLEQMVSSN